MKRLGFVVSLAGHDGGVYVAESAGKAKCDALLNLGDVCPDITFADLRCRRAPAYDDRVAEDWNGWGEGAVQRALAEDAACAAWNAAHPVGTPVVVRRDGGGETHTRTRSAAAIIGYRAVVWCEGIPSCYALSHVSPTDHAAPAASVSPSVPSIGGGES
ncbi:MAG TPA: hypothetical protein VK358_13145 [Longimicrobium sp.]|nr:hypothetical protein [Longimicrobium sp.]